jgi:two-component system chemotaxis response regulator CheB
MAKTRVLVVDDSAFMRKVISDMIAEDPAFEVVGTARDGLEALQKVAKLQPDLVTLDVEMPRKDGLETLRDIMASSPVPVVMLSSVTHSGAKATIEALALGAVDFVPKPSGAISLDIEKIKDELISKLKAAALAKVQPVKARLEPFGGRPEPVRAKPQPIKSVSLPPAKKPAAFPQQPDSSSPRSIVAIGASTGGPRALEAVLRQFPKDLPAAVLVVQHMPAGFTRSMAERLDQLSSITVKEAEEGERIRARVAYVAPGDYHMVIGAGATIRLEQTPPVNYVRPSVDVTFLSLPPAYARQAVGVILTGMGKDGAAGMAQIKAAGGVTIVQDENTSVIYSMPRAVVENGDADFILPLDRIGDAAVRAVTTLAQRGREEGDGSSGR